MSRMRRLLLLALPLLFYCALPSRNFYWDGVAFAIDIEKRLPAASLASPSHLIYMLWGAWLFQLAGSAGIHTRALFVMQAANCVLGGLSVILVYQCLRLRKMPEMLSIAGALVFGFSATWWRFATDANAYVPSIFLLLCADILLENPSGAVLAGFAQAGAMLFHELALLFLPVALFRLRKTRPAMLAYAAAALIPVAAAYLAAYQAASNHTGFFAWLTTHSPDSGFFFNPFTNLALSVRGTARLFFGGKLRDFAGDAISKAAVAGLLVAAIAFLAYARRAIRTAHAPSPQFHLYLWVGIYAAFLFFWMPQNTFYRLFYLPPLIGILVTMLRDAPAARMAVFFVPVLFLWNFTFLVYPQSRPAFSAPLRFALARHDTWAPGSAIVFHRFHPDLWTISYFNPQVAWIGLDRADLDQLERNLEYARTGNKPLWLEETAYELIAADANGRQWLSVHERPGELLQFKDEKHQFRFHCVR